MKEIWYFRAYNHRANEMARFLVTGTQDEATATVTDYLGRDWKIQVTRMVAKTTDDVFMEIQ